MDERSWDECRSPQDALLALQGRAFGARQANLFACACCLPLWDLLPESSRPHLFALERAVDDRATAREVEEAHAYWQRRTLRRSRVPGVDQAHVAMRAWVYLPPPPSERFVSLMPLSRSAAEALAKRDPWPGVRRRQAVVLRDIVGNPFRPAPPVRPEWLAWQDGLVPSLARSAYDERALPGGELDAVRLAVLADALEEAGCDESALLLHLREPGPHVRGCWVVDRLRGQG